MKNILYEILSGFSTVIAALFLINGVVFAFMTTILAIILFLPLFLVLLVIIEIEKICHTIF